MTWKIYRLDLNRPGERAFENEMKIIQLNVRPFVSRKLE
jgi:hypothetical protein